VTRTIFRGGGAEQQVYKDDKPASTFDRRGKAAARGSSRDRGARGAKRPAQKKGGFAGPLVLLTILIIVGLAGLFGLQHLFKVG